MSALSTAAPSKADASSALLAEKIIALNTLISQQAFATAPSSDIINKIEKLIASFIESIKALKTQNLKYRIYDFLKTRDWNWDKEKGGIDPRVTHLILSRALKILDQNVTSIDLTIEKLFLLKVEEISKTNQTLQMLVTKIISEKSLAPSLASQRNRAGSLGTDRFPTSKKETAAGLKALDKNSVTTSHIASSSSKPSETTFKNREATSELRPAIKSTVNTPHTSSPSSAISLPTKPSEAKNLVPFKLERSASLGAAQLSKQKLPPVPSSPKPPIPVRKLVIEESKPPASINKNASFHSISLHSSPQSSTHRIESKSEECETLNFKNFKAFQAFLLEHIKNEKSYHHSLQDYGIAKQPEFDAAFVKINTYVFEKISDYLTKIQKKEYVLPAEISEPEFILYAYLFDLYQLYLEPSDLTKIIGEKFESPSFLTIAISYSMVLRHFIKKVETITFAPFSYSGISKLREKEIAWAYKNYRETPEGKRCVLAKFKSMCDPYLKEAKSPHPFEIAKVGYFNTYSTIPDWINKWLKQAT